MRIGMGMMVCLLIVVMLGKRSCLYVQDDVKERNVNPAMRGRGKGGSCTTF